LNFWIPIMFLVRDVRLHEYVAVSVESTPINIGGQRDAVDLPFLLKEFRRLGFGAVISSDCHDSRYLGCAFEDAAELLRTAGFTERYLLTPDGFTAVAL
jgi:hypothetical protein